jgi:hypothetical protein
MLLFGFNGRATRNFLILLVSMHYILFIDRVNLAAAAPVMQQDLGLSNLALGLAFSAFNYAYAPFQLVGGWFADRFGARRTLTICGLVWSLTTIATGAVTGLASLFGVRLVLGMGEGATLPAATRAVPSRYCEFVDSRLRRSPPDRARAVPYGQAGENAMRFPHLAHRSAAAHKLHSTPQQDKMNLISGKRETSSGLPGPLAYSSPEAVQTTGTVAGNVLQFQC